MSTKTEFPVNAMPIMQDTTFEPGEYLVPKGITITGENITLDGNFATLNGKLQEGIALKVSNAKSVTIKNINLSNYYHGIFVDNCESITLENIRVRDTAEVQGIDTFLHLWKPIEDAYGGGIVLNKVKYSTIKNCDVQHQQNGIQLFDCEYITVENNNASFNSGWGMYLSNSNHNIVKDNQFDFCNRLFRRPENGSIRAEADAAGIVMVKGSSHNKLLRNTCIGGGDGIFIAGYEHPGKVTPCSYNLIEDNDCRLSPNNAIESTFSRGNIFRRNDVSRSNYGLWMGYSWDNTVEENIVEYSRFAGIAVEHGFNFDIRGNILQRNTEGMRLWVRGGEIVLQYWRGHEVTHSFTIEDNLFEMNNIGFHGYTPERVEGIGEALCHNFHLKNNTFRDNRTGAWFEHVKYCSAVENVFENNVIDDLKLGEGADVVTNTPS